MRIAITTLGCKVNQSESALISGRLKRNGHEIVRHTDNPDVFIVNTCTVTAKSDYQSRQMVRRAVKSGARVIATGCYAQLKPEALSQIKGVDLVLGNAQKNMPNTFVEALQLKDNRNTNNISADVIIESPEAPVTSGGYYSTRARALLKIQDGCNFSCSYCAVPMARGKSRSLPLEKIIDAIDELSEKGYREIVLTGIHIGSYGLDLQPKSSLLEIFDKAVHDYPEMRFRLTSIEPQEFKRELLKFIKRGAVCRHVHIPLQSGSDRILKAMNRGYTTTFYRKLIHNIISECPDIAIGTDVIVGFPGEDDRDFEKTTSILQELPFSYIHVFPYSKRPDTRASVFSNHLKNALKKQRTKIIRDISIKKKKEYISKQTGKTLDVLIEQRDKINGFYEAISDNYVRTQVRAAGALQIGQRLLVKVSELSDSTLISTIGE